MTCPHDDCGLDKPAMSGYEGDPTPPKKPASVKTYLGDSVYADIENGMIKLTTENGGPPNDIIFLEPAVFDALVAFVKRQAVQP